MSDIGNPPGMLSTVRCAFCLPVCWFMCCGTPVLPAISKGDPEKLSKVFEVSLSVREALLLPAM